MDDDYSEVRKRPLKLIDTKKTKHKRENSVVSKNDSLAGISPESRVIISTATKAEQAFKAKQDSVAQARILKKASKTHKQRVEEFNKHLDSLSEHYDIPKVSWTK